MGIVIDADTNLSGRWQRISQILVDSEKYGVPYTLPNNGLVLLPYDEEDPKIGVWIMPDNNMNGMLEDFLAMLAVNDQNLLEEVDATLYAIED